MPYYPDYSCTTKDLSATFSQDPAIKAERSKNLLCHELLRLAKEGDNNSLCRLFDSGRASLTTIYERFDFVAWLDPGGGFVAKNVTLFQAALLKPEEFGPLQSDGSINGIRTGKSFSTLLPLLDKYNIDKSILLNQDATGRTVLHLLSFTSNPQDRNIIQLLEDRLSNEPGIKDELWNKKDNRGKLAYEKCGHSKYLLSDAAAESNLGYCLATSMLKRLFKTFVCLFLFFLVLEIC